MNIVFVHSKGIPDQYQVLWRCSNIARAIERTGLHHAALVDIPGFIANTRECQAKCENADLIVIHRYDVGGVLTAALYWKARRKKVVLDLDEAIDLISEDAGDHQFWRKGEITANFMLPKDFHQKIVPPPIQQLTWAATSMDAVTVSSGRLAGDWQGYGQVCEILDYIDFDQYKGIQKHPSDEIWIGMGGSPVSFEAMEQSGLLSAVEEVCRQRPNVRLFIGNISAETTKHFEISENQIITHTWLPPEEWVFHLSNLSIGLAVAETEYDFRSSRNRVLEYMAAKIPWIASNHLPYRELEKYGMLVENTRDAWIQGLTIMIDSLDTFQQQAAGKPYLYAVSQDIDENIGKILNVYDSILQN